MLTLGIFNDVMLLSTSNSKSKVKHRKQTYTDTDKSVVLAAGKKMAHLWGDAETRSAHTAVEIAAVELATAIDLDLYHYATWLGAEQLRTLDTFLQRKEGGDDSQEVAAATEKGQRESYTLRHNCTNPCCGRCHSNTFGLRRR